MSITVWVIENILYGLMRPATSIAAATALMAAFALSPLMAVSSKKRGAQAPLFFVGKMPIHKNLYFARGMVISAFPANMYWRLVLYLIAAFATPYFQRI